MSNADSRITTSPSPRRVVMYVDGLNLYYGLREARWRRYYWLDLRRLAQSLLLSGQSLAAVRYFTARFNPDTADPGRHIRQDTYLRALDTLPGLSIQYGYHLPKTRDCPRCGASLPAYEEKMTDVNIAVALLNDAQDNLFDTAIVISADSDRSSPISAVRIGMPTNRSSSLSRQRAFPKNCDGAPLGVSTSGATLCAAISSRIPSSSPTVMPSPNRSDGVETPAVGECQQRGLRDFADGQDWGRGAAVAALAVGMAAGGWRSGLGFEGLATINHC